MTGRAAASYRRTEGDTAQSGRIPEWLPRPLFWSGVAGVAYFLVTLAVTAVEVFSEMSKLSRGSYSNTFSPFLLTHLLTFPTSVVHSDWPGYPDVFNEAQWKGVVWHALGPVTLTMAIQSVLLVALLWFLVSFARWARPTPWTP